MPSKFLPRGSWHVLTRMQHVAAADSARLRQLTRRLEELAPAYAEYLSVLREARATQQSLDATRAFVGDEGREATPLWCQMRHYLRFAGQASFADILTAFRDVGITASRQAIESAIRAHPRVFGKRQRGAGQTMYLKNRSEHADLAPMPRRTAAGSRTARAVLPSAKRLDERG